MGRVTRVMGVAALMMVVGMGAMMLACPHIHHESSLKQPAEAMGMLFASTVAKVATWIGSPLPMAYNIQQVVSPDGVSEGEQELLDGLMGDRKAPRPLLSGGLWGAEAQFAAFMRAHKKEYKSSEEHSHRFNIFSANLEKARYRQVLDPHAVHGVSPFMDLTEEEFQQYMGLVGDIPRGYEGHNAPLLPVHDLPENFDWREKGAVTDVKNQGACGSCWAFATVGAVESAHFLKTGELVTLSEQQLVDCDHQCEPENQDICDNGCMGGLPWNALEYLSTSKGLVAKETYPYSAQDGQCKTLSEDQVVTKVKNWTFIPKDEKQIMAHLIHSGPLAVGLNANWLQTYIGGVHCPLVCVKSHMNHGVLVVGYGEGGYAPIRFKNKPFWTVKNSWGAAWGEHGYFRICKGMTDVCGVDVDVVSPIV